MSVVDSKPRILVTILCWVAMLANGVMVVILTYALITVLHELTANSAPVRIWEGPASPAERAEPPGPVTILPICASGWRCAADASDLLWCSCQMPKRGEP